MTFFSDWFQNPKNKSKLVEVLNETRPKQTLIYLQFDDDYPEVKFSFPDGDTDPLLNTKIINFFQKELITGYYFTTQFMTPDNLFEVINNDIVPRPELSNLKKPQFK